MQSVNYFSTSMFFSNVKNKFNRFLHNRPPVSPSPHEGTTSSTSGSCASASSSARRTAPPTQATGNLNSNGFSAATVPDTSLLKNSISEGKQILSQQGPMDGPDVDKFFEELKDLRKIHYSPNGPKMISLIEDYITSGRVHIDAKLPGSQIETLRYIVGHGYPEVTDHLIKLGSNPNAQGAIKYTALHLLIVAYFQDMDKVLEEIDILVNNEADLSLRDDDNLMPLDSGLFLAITMPEDYLSDNALTLKLNKLIGKCQSELCESTLKEAINNRHYDNKPYTPEQLERLKVIYDCVRKGEPIPDINNFRGRAFQIWDL